MSTAINDSPGEPQDRPGAINARPVRHPGRWVAMAIIAILVAMLLSSFLTNPAWDFGFMFRVMNFRPVLTGLLYGTIIGTIGAMLIGVVLGVTLAVMRLSDNPVLRGTSFVYTWFFRAIPRYVLLIILGVGLITLYPKFDIGIPFGQQIAGALGLDWDMTIGSLSLRDWSTTLAMGTLGLGLSEAAYMAEIARAGILSVDRGQAEAAQAIGMAPGKTMRRVVLPQAMRVIVPPTGNETIAMVKDTSLLTGMGVTNELFFQAQTVASTTYRIMPAYLAAVVWYLIVCSVLMVGQSYLERHFGRGFGTAPVSGRDRKIKALLNRTAAH